MSFALHLECELVGEIARSSRDVEYAPFDPKVFPSFATNESGSREVSAHQPRVEEKASIVKASPSVNLDRAYRRRQVERRYRSHTVIPDPSRAFIRHGGVPLLTSAGAAQEWDKACQRQANGIGSFDQSLQQPNAEQSSVALTVVQRGDREFVFQSIGESLYLLGVLTEGLFDYVPGQFVNRDEGQRAVVGGVLSDRAPCVGE